MSPKLIDRIMTALPAIESRHGLTGEDAIVRPFTFFGGEPLLARNRRIVEYFMNAARSLGKTTFSAVSNATELDAYADLLGPDGIAQIQVTVDGPPDMHDTRRIRADGSGSFGEIADNISLALSLGTRIDVRTNVDRTNLTALPRLAQEYMRRGWPDSEFFSAYATPVHAYTPLDRKTTLNSLELRQELERLEQSHPELAAIAAPDDNLLGRAHGIFEGRFDPFTMFKASFCGAHNKMYVFDAFGDIYACWERTGDKAIRTGWIDESGAPQFVADRLEAWRSRTVASNETCAQCRYALYCGGGCAVLAEGIHGTQFGNYCDAFGRRFREAISRAYTEHTSGQRRVSDAISALRDL